MKNAGIAQRREQRTRNAQVEGSNPSSGFKVHTLKSWVDNFDAIVQGRTMADVRLNDRGYGLGDVLHLRQYNPTTRRFTGHETRVTVVGVVAKVPGLKRGYCVLSIKLTAGDLTRWCAESAGKKK